MKLIIILLISLFSISALAEGAYPKVRVSCNGNITSPDGSLHYILFDVVSGIGPYLQIIVDPTSEEYPLYKNWFWTFFHQPIDNDPKLIESENGLLKMTKVDDEGQSWFLAFELLIEALAYINDHKPEWKQVPSSVLGIWSGAVVCVDNRNLNQ